MNLFSELITAVQSDLTINDDSTLYPIATVKLALNRAYIKCGGLFLWPETEDAKKTSTQANIEYYDYPATWRPDSIWKLEVDDVDYGDPLGFKDYMFEKENDVPCGRDYIWSSQHRRYFIYPIPTTAGDYNISVWGQKTVDALTNDGDVTIWSYSMPECNEAVVLEAEAILKKKGQDVRITSSGGTMGDLISVEAKQILSVAWSKIRQGQEKYQQTQPMFDTPDFFSQTVTHSQTGKFNIR